MSGRIGGTLVVRGLVLHLDAANTDSYVSTTRWNDLTPNNAVLTSSGGTTFTSTNAGSVNFNSVDEFYVSNTIIQPTNLTISAWFKPTGPSSPDDSFGGCIIIHNSGNTIGYTLAYSWAQRNVSISTKQNDFLSSPNFTAPQNTYTNATVVQDETQQYIYINGEFVASRPYVIPIVYPSSGDRFLRIGNWGVSSSFKRNFVGEIAQVLLYDRALTAGEARQNFLALRGRFGL